MNTQNAAENMKVNNEKLQNAIVAWNNMDGADRAKIIDKMPLKIMNTKNSQIMMVWIASVL